MHEVSKFFANVSLLFFIVGTNILIEKYFLDFLGIYDCCLMTKTNDIIDSLLNVKTFNRFNVEEEAKDFFKGLLRLRSQVFKSKKEDWDFLSVL